MIPGDRGPGLGGPAVQERPHLVASRVGDDVRQRLPRGGGDALQPHPVDEPQHDERHEPRADEQDAERPDVEQGEHEHHRRDAEPCEEPVGHEHRHEERGAGHRCPEQPEEPGQVTRIGEPFGGGGRPRQVEREEQDREQHGGERHPHEQSRPPHVPERDRQVSPGRRGRAPGLADPWLRERPGRGQHHAAEPPRDREGGRPDQEQVLGPDQTHERVREQAAQHRPEDLARGEQREQALRAPRVGDDAGGAPDEHVLQQDRERHRQPEDREDPLPVAEQCDAFGEDHGTEPGRDREVRAAPVDPPEQRRQSHHEHERRRALCEVHQRERIGADPVEEERVRSALPDREAGHAHERQGGHRQDEPRLAGTDLQRPLQRAHRTCRTGDAAEDGVRATTVSGPARPRRAHRRAAPARRPDGP